MHIIVPRKITFTVDPDFHTVNVATKWKQWAESLNRITDVFLSICQPTKALATAKFAAEALDALNNYQDFQSKKVRASDFRIEVWSSEVDEEGQFWQQHSTTDITFAKGL